MNRTLEQRLLDACRDAGFEGAVVHQCAGLMTRLIRIPGIGKEGADQLNRLVRGPLTTTGFTVDYFGYDCRFGGDDFKGAMIYGTFPDMRRADRQVEIDRRPPGDPA